MYAKDNIIYFVLLFTFICTVPSTCRLEPEMQSQAFKWCAFTAFALQAHLTAVRVFLVKLKTLW